MISALTTDSQQRFAAIVTAHAGLIRAHCRRSLHEADADDATQAVFICLWRHRHLLDEPEPRLVSWLLTVADNVVRNARRDRARRSCGERAAAEEWQRHLVSLADREAPVPVASQPALDAILDQGLAALPRREREAVRLHYLAGYTYRRIAEETGSATSTVADRVQRGLDRLRRWCRKAGVAATLALLTSRLEAAGREAHRPLPPMIMDSLLFFASATGDGSSTAGPIPQHIIRWSIQDTPSMPQKVAPAALAALLSLFLTLLVAAESDSPPADAADGGDRPSSSAPSETPASDQTATAADTPAAAAIEGHHAILIRLHNGKRTWERLLESPYGHLLNDQIRTALAPQMTSIGSGYFLLDPESYLTDEEQTERARKQQELWEDTAAMERLREQAEPMADAQGIDRANGEPSFIDSRLRLEVGHPDAAASLQLFLTKQLGATGTKATESGERRLRYQEGAIAFDSDYYPCTTKLAWITDLTPSDPAADLEVRILFKPTDPQAFAAWAGRAAPTDHLVGSLTARLGPDGLAISGRFEELVPAKVRREAPQPIAAEVFRAVPRDALAAIAMQAGGRDQTLGNLIDMFKPMAQEAPEADTNGILRVTSEGTELQTFGRLSRMLGAFKPALQEARGTILAYARPAPLIPSWTVEIPLAEQISKETLQRLAAAFEVQPDAEGTLTFSTGYSMLHAAQRDGRLVLTTDIQGMTGWAAPQRGFDQIPAIAAQLADERCHRAGLALVRDAALLQQIGGAIALLGDPALRQQVATMTTAQNDQVSWMAWDTVPQATTFEAEGTCNAILLPILAPTLAGLLPPMANQ